MDFTPDPEAMPTPTGYVGRVWYITDRSTGERHYLTEAAYARLVLLRDLYLRGLV